MKCSDGCGGSSSRRSAERGTRGLRWDEGFARWSCGYSGGRRGTTRRGPGRSALSTSASRSGRELASTEPRLTDLVPAVVPVTLEIFQVVQRLLTIENPDVLRLGRRQTADRPAQMHEVRLDRWMQRVHHDLAWQVVRLAGVAGAAGSYDVRPVVHTAP